MNSNLMDWIVKYSWLDKKKSLVENIAYLLLAVMGILFVAKYYNPYMFDHMGHLSSALSFSPYEFSDKHFMGGVYGTSYPFLQDILLKLLSFFSDAQMQIYYIYLFIVTVLYVVSLYLISLELRTVLAKSTFYIFSAIVLFGGGKQLNYQGGRLVDVAIFGLSNQVLSLTFFYMLLRELFYKKRIKNQVTLVTLSICTHFVTGLVSLGLVSLFTKQDNKKTYLPIILPLLISSFFIIGVFLSEISVANVATPAGLPLLVGTFLVVILRAVDIRLWVFSLLLIVPNIVAMLLHWFGMEIPISFHYYRLQIFAFSFMVFLIAFSLDKAKKLK